MAKLSKRILFIACIVALVSHAQIKKEDIGKSIIISELQHPYLFFTNNEKPKILERIKTDPESRIIMKGLLLEGNRFISMPFQKKILLQPRHPRFEPENEAASYLAEISKGALTLSFLYQMTGNTEYTPRAIEYAEAICDAPEWINGAHTFDIIYPRVWPRNVPDDQVLFSYDLNSARVARVLSTVYDWLYPVMTGRQRDKLRNAILEKAITRVRGNYEFFWWSSAYRCNWSAICFSGLGLSSLALLKEHPQLADVVAESYNRITLAYDQIGEEGGWQEGRGYYGYMVHSGAYFMDALKRVSNGKINLFLHPRIRANAYDFQLYALTAAFGDSEGKNGGPTYAINKYVSETGSVTSAFYRDTFFSNGDDIFDILWPRSSLQGVEPQQKSKLFKNIDWALLRSDFLDPSKVTIACKAGFNDDPHHGHLDCGQFSLTWKNIPFIKDLGSMKYDEQYFNNERFDYLYASSEGHNVIAVNGEQQIIAKKKNKKWQENIGGKILDFRSGEQRDYVLMDPTHAYPGKELKKWRRNIILEKPVVTLIVDEIETEIGSKISTRFFPGVGKNSLIEGHDSPANENGRTKNEIGQVRVSKDHVVLTDHRGNSMALIPVVLNNVFSIIDDRSPNLLVAKNAVVEWFQHVNVEMVAKETKTIVATLILPVENEQDAQSKVKSLIVSMVNKDSFSVSSGAYHWTFERKKEGFSLAKD